MGRRYARRTLTARVVLRLRITWLTIASLLMFAALAALSPHVSQTNAHFATTTAALARALDFANSSDLLNGFRGSLAADMLFLIAYGFLLRASGQWHAPWDAGVVAAGLALFLMAFDAIENIAMLRNLSLLVSPGFVPSDHVTWTTRIGSLAAIAKWTTGGMISLLLAQAWRRQRWEQRGRERLLSTTISILFAGGGAAALVVAFLYWFPDWRIASDPTSARPFFEYTQLAALLLPAVAAIGQIAALGLPSLLLRFLTLCRVPFGVMLAIALFGPIGLGPQAALLGGILKLRHPYTLAVATFASLLVALAAGAQISLIRSYAWRRFRDRHLHVLTHPCLAVLVFRTAVVAGLWLPTCAWMASRELGNWSLLIAVPIGAGGALMLAIVVEYLAVRFADPLVAQTVPQYVVASLNAEWLTDWLLDARRFPPPAWVATWRERVRRLTDWWLGSRHAPGYVDRIHGRTVVLPGHIVASLLFATNLLVYWAVIGAKIFWHRGIGGSQVPTLTSIVLLILLIAWMLGALSFLLDRYRVPIVSALAVLALLTGSMKATDHVFPVQEKNADGSPRSPYSERTPGQVLASFASANPILIAANGGGIQAGVWTTQVFEGLDSPHLLNGTLRDRVALVSAVSGGSMGALYFGASYESSSLRQVRKYSAQSSLDEVATAFVGLDIWRVTGFPFVSPLAQDRGRALEDTWRERANKMTPNPLNADAPDLLLKTWAERAGMANSAATTRFPAFLFNTTVVETGQPMAFATTEFPSNNFRKAFVELPHRYPVVVGFNALFDLYDGGAARDVGLSMVTAARMSSAFPYVSPAASPNWSAPPKDSGDAAKKKEEKKKGAKNYHLVDGGYYDNYGLVGLSQWLDDALTELKESASRPTRVTIVIVRDEEHPTADEVPQKGWLTQLVDPPLAFLQTRAYGHWAGGRAALKLLEEKWKGTVTIQDVAFVYPLKQVRSTHPECGTPPISWLMTATEDACVTYAWRASEPAILRFKQIAIPGALEGAPDAAAAPPAAEGLPTPASVSPPAARPHE